MENVNDNSAVPTLTAAATAAAAIEVPDANTTPTPASKERVSSSSSFSSDLVTRTKLLTREEECTLKTALAFVVIKTRAKAKANKRATAIATATAAIASSGTSNKKQRIIADSSAEAKDFSESTVHYESISILDHLFCHDRSSSNSCNSNEQREREHERGFPTPKPRPSRSLECSGGRTHIDHMFRAAKTLAETWLVTNQTQQQQFLRRDRPPSARSTTKALVGATGHLAHQLQLLLVAAAANHPTSNGATIAKHKKSTAQQPASSSPAKQRDRGKTTLSRARYRRPSLSSRSAADSTSTPSSSSQTAAATATATATAAVVVTPATSHHNSHKNKNKNGVECNQNNRTVETVFLVQEWIRSTLLQQDALYQGTTPSTPGATNKETKVSRTILSCHNTTVLDVLASFHVYTIMIPQIARISPPLIGHVFQVVARLVKDLYSDKIAVVGEDTAFRAAGSSGNGEKDLGRTRNARKLLDHLVTSALALLELCWTTEIAVGRSRASCEESHRSFLLLSLQEILGDLLVPLSRSELSGEHYRSTISASRKRTLHERQHQQVVRRNQKGQGVFQRFSESQHHRQARQQQRRFVLQRQNQNESKSEPTVQTFQKAPTDASACAREEDIGNEKAATTKFQASRVVLSPPPPKVGCLLDPEAKLLLRMAVYRLILMGKKG
jgi:hypothetical protein